MIALYLLTLLVGNISAYTTTVLNRTPEGLDILDGERISFRSVRAIGAVCYCISMVLGFIEFGWITGVLGFIGCQLVAVSFVRSRFNMAVEYIHLFAFLCCVFTAVLITISVAN